MVQANYKHPVMKKVKVWAGLYGGHYDIIVFFKRRPKRSKEDYPLGSSDIKKWYDCLENKKIIVGDMALCDFQQLYPDADISPYLENGRPKEIEIIEVFQLELEAVWTKYGDLDQFKTHVDW